MSSFHKAGLHAFSCKYVDLFIKNVWLADESPVEAGDYTLYASPLSDGLTLPNSESVATGKVKLYPHFWFTAPEAKTGRREVAGRPLGRDLYTHDFFIARNRGPADSDDVENHIPYLSTLLADQHLPAIEESFNATRQRYFSPALPHETSALIASFGIFDPASRHNPPANIAMGGSVQACRQNLLRSHRPATGRNPPPVPQNSENCIDVGAIHHVLDRIKKTRSDDALYPVIYQDSTRALTTWVDTHNFVAQHRLSQSRPSEALELTGPQLAALAKEIDESLVLLESGRG